MAAAAVSLAYWSMRLELPTAWVPTAAMPTPVLAVHGTERGAVDLTY
jgi:hypothetical protein